jgi:hypothetical protein
MAYDATEILGAPQVAGARVLTKGYIKRQAAGPGGVGLAGGVPCGVPGVILSASATEVVGRQQKKEQAPGRHA